MLCHEPVHDGVLVVPLLVGGVGGLLAEAVVQVLQELEALPGHRAVDVGAEERVDEHAGGREAGGRDRRRRGRRRRGDFRRRGHGPAVALRRESQHAVAGSADLHVEDDQVAADLLQQLGTPPVRPINRGSGSGSCASVKRVRPLYIYNIYVSICDKTRKRVSPPIFDEGESRRLKPGASYTIVGSGIILSK